VTTSPNLQPRSDDPDWLAVLRAVAAAQTVKDAAERIGFARSSIALVLSGRYPGGTGRIEAAVRRHLMNQVACPGFGEDIPAADCREWASRPFSAASGRAAQMWRSCQACPNRPKEINHAEC